MRALVVAVLAGMALMAAGGARAARAGEEPRLRRVVLSAGGVGYFEFAASMDGPGTLALPVPLSQVDDVLKSLVVLDPSGRVGGLELPGPDGAAAALADLPVPEAALQSFAGLVNALRGTEVEVRGPRPLRGRVVKAETTEEPDRRRTDGPPVQRTRVTLLTGDGFAQFVLEDADSVRLTDPALAAQFDAALAALRGAAPGSARRITVRLDGAGAREVRLGYVAGAPLWKATYRLVLPADDTQPARLQAWAVLENAGVADWNGVELSLLWGNPVTFRQALYRQYFVARPDVPVETLARLLPDADTGAMAAFAKRGVAAAPAPAMASATPQRMRGAATSTGTEGLEALPAPAPLGMADLAAPEAPAFAAEGGEATLFRVAQPVSLAAGHSASVPILDRSFPALRVGLVQPDRRHPLATVRLENNGAESLPAGVLTIYDAADAATFLGDARLGGLPSGQTRLLSFAEDLRTGVDWASDVSQGVIAVAAANGVLRVTERTRTRHVITLTAPPKEPRKLLLEVPRPAGGDVSLHDEAGATPDAVLTARAWRVRADLAADETRRMVFFVDQPTGRTIALLNDAGAVAALLDEDGLPAPARAALAEIQAKRATLADRQNARARLDAERQEVEHDEERLRDNLERVTPGDALRSRLLDSLAADEDRLAALARAIGEADQAIAAAEAALREAVQGLEL